MNRITVLVLITFLSASCSKTPQEGDALLGASALDWITAISSILTPILILILSYIFAKISKTQESIQNLQEKLHNNRMEIYNGILEPYIIMITPEEILHKQKKYQNNKKTSGELAGEIIASTEYKFIEFKLFIIGSDGVVRAYNELKKFFYSGKADGTDENTKEALKLTAILVLEIRKSVGNKDTKLKYQDAYSWFIKDADKIL